MKLNSKQLILLSGCSKKQLLKTVTFQHALLLFWATFLAPSCSLTHFVRALATLAPHQDGEKLWLSNQTVQPQKVSPYAD